MKIWLALEQMSLDNTERGGWQVQYKLHVIYISGK